VRKGASGTIYVRYLSNNNIDLFKWLPAGSRLKLRLPKRNAWRAINYTFHVSADLARYVTGLVSSSSTDRTDRWTEWAAWSPCNASECGEAGLRTRRRICVSTTGGVCSPGTPLDSAPCLGGGPACAAAIRALSKISCLVGNETPAQILSKKCGLPFTVYFYLLLSTSVKLVSSNQQ